MKPLSRFKCCDKCRHDTANPCPQFVECMTEGPLCHDDEACREKKRRAAALARRDDVEKPTVFVGAGTCGLAAGAAGVIDAVQKYIADNNIDADIVEVGCVGFCAAEVMMDVALPGRTKVSFGPVDQNEAPAVLRAMIEGRVDADKVIGQYRGEGLDPWADTPYFDEHPFFAPQTRWVLANCGVIDPAAMDEYVARGGYRAFATALRTMVPTDVCDAVEKSGLRGRGGGGFPTGKKWKFAADAPGTRKYIICNADEGDPGAFMDRAVIEGDPHRLVEGAAIAAYAIGADKAYIYIRAEYPLAIKRLRQAIADAEAEGLIGNNILDSGFCLDIEIKMGAGAFVCGEETALIGSIEGRRGMPRPRPPFPAVKGLFGMPTIINNVETFANVPVVLAIGADEFASLGTTGSKGTKVFALSGKIARTGLVEVAMGASLSTIVYDVGGGAPGGKKIKAVQIGGPSGGCIPADKLDIEVDYESIKAFGAMMGSGGLVVMDEDNCMVDVAKFFMDFIQRESCGKCIPCREGTRRMLEVLEAITRGRKNEGATDALTRFKGVMYLNRLAETIKDTSLCGLGQTAPNPVLSTLRWFRDEYEAHIYDRKCPAGVCGELLTYKIDTDKCRGCTLCAKKCPAGAIVGEVKKAHYIIDEKCIGCGNCVTVCRFDAVTVE